MDLKDRHPVSASQIETFGYCERKWGLDKLDGVPRPTNRHAQRGTDVHAVLEKWQRDGVVIDFDSDTGKIASSGLRFLPRPGTLHVEHNFTFRTDTAVYRGLKDLKSKGGAIRSVWDHKTTSDFRWMKTPVRLRRDAQAIIYAVDEIVSADAAGESFDSLELNWIYYLADPKRPKARKVKLHVLPDESAPIPECPPEVKKEHFGIMYFDELYERFAEIEQTAAKILGYHALHAEGKIKGSELPYDVSACDAFGGCPYRNKACVLTVSERVSSMEAKISMADKMKAALEKGGDKKQDAPATPTASAPKPSPSAKSAAGAIKGQQQLPNTNPPEHGKGVDPDAKAPGKISSGDRMEMAARMAGGLISMFGTSYDPETMAELSVKYADAVLAELAK